MLSRTSKQFLIGGIYILIALLIVGGVYFSKTRPTCVDGLKNGQEEGVDCGTLACGKACEAPVQALLIQHAQLIRTPADDYDLAFEVVNPNAEFGAGNVEYSWTFYDGNSPVPHREGNGGIGSFYILPGQTKYIVVTAVRFQSAMTPDDVPEIKDVIIKSVTWEKVAGGQSNPLVVTRESLSSTAQSATYEAVVTNNSNFDFDTVDVGVVVRDAAGKLIATNTTNLQTLLSHTDRSVKMTWPFPIPADARVDIEAGTNVFNNANFLKTNGTQEKFQQYY